jgi:iron complex transport system ATP-binding protein
MNDPRPAPIVARNLRLAYPRGPVVIESEEITVASGALVSLVGPNGSGKTTLLRSIAGLLPPRDGTILVAGSRMYGRHAVPRRERARLLSVVLTDRVTPAYLLVKELVSLGRLPFQSLLGGTTPRDRDAVTRAMEETGVTHLAERQVGRLSDGERQRVMIARALAQEPCILLLDEPAAHLDPPHQTALFALLERLVTEEVVASVVVATHHLHLALHFSRGLLLVSNGQVQSGPPRELLADGSVERAFAPGAGAGSEAHGSRSALRLDHHRGWFMPENDPRS